MTKDFEKRAVPAAVGLYGGPRVVRQRRRFCGGGPARDWTRSRMDVNISLPFSCHKSSKIRMNMNHDNNQTTTCLPLMDRLFVLLLMGNTFSDAFVADPKYRSNSRSSFLRTIVVTQKTPAPTVRTTSKSRQSSAKHLFPSRTTKITTARSIRDSICWNLRVRLFRREPSLRRPRNRGDSCGSASW